MQQMPTEKQEHIQELDEVLWTQRTAIGGTPNDLHLIIPFALSANIMKTGIIWYALLYCTHPEIQKPIWELGNQK